MDINPSGADAIVNGTVYSGQSTNSQNTVNMATIDGSTTPTVMAQSPTVTATQPSSSLSTPPADDRPIPVVKVLSVKGVEYGMMTLTLWAAAASLIWVLISVVSGKFDFDLLIYPTSFLIVTLPVFSLFYLRLRKAEINSPDLRLDPSKRRWSQITQILAFIVCVANTVTFVYHVLGKISSDYEGSLTKDFLNLVLVLVVAGGILVYYWFDEHKLVDRLRG